MNSHDMLHTAEQDGRALLAAAELDWTRPVPCCPGWDAAELVRHMGAILTWMGAIVTSRQRRSRRDLPAPPQDPADLSSWYGQQLARTVAILRDTDPDAETWTFSTLAEHRVGWWRRRLAVEIAIHRWDAEFAAGLQPSPLDGDVAASGIAEFMTEFLAGLLTDSRNAAINAADGIRGALHLHATDGDSEWWADLDHPGAVAQEHRKGDVAIRGTRSDLLLWLTNREPSQPLTILGERAMVEAWSQLQR